MFRTNNVKSGVETWKTPPGGAAGFVGGRRKYYSKPAVPGGNKFNGVGIRFALDFILTLRGSI